MVLQLAHAPEEKAVSETDRPGVEAVLRISDTEDDYCESPRVVHYSSPFFLCFPPFSGQILGYPYLLYCMEQSPS